MRIFIIAVVLIVARQYGAVDWDIQFLSVLLLLVGIVIAAYQDIKELKR